MPLWPKRTALAYADRDGGWMLNRFTAGVVREVPPTGVERLRWLRAATTEEPGAAAAGSGSARVRTPKQARVEAALLVAPSPLTPRRLAQCALLADATEARTIVRQLNEHYDAAETPFRVQQVAAGFQLLTRPHYSHWLTRLHERQSQLKLSPSAMETLAIVAYRQPVTRADVEAIRGVVSLEILKQLLDRGLIRIAGADDSLGRPHLYETTRRFLELFGLKSLDDLPHADRLRTSGAAGEPPSRRDAA